MYQYFCEKCREPVSKEFDKPVLENRAIVICRSCVKRSTTPVVINITPFEDAVAINNQMANELAAQFGGAN